MAADSTNEQTWDAGAMGCGELILLLKVRMHNVPRGEVLHLIATDPGAREDLPAWCRLTGHRLIQHDHPHYRITR
jgi:tRNA 2-thiouridine synthesizing protein A